MDVGRILFSLPYVNWASGRAKSRALLATSSLKCSLICDARIMPRPNLRASVMSSLRMLSDAVSLTAAKREDLGLVDHHEQPESLAVVSRLNSVWVHEVEACGTICATASRLQQTGFGPAIYSGPDGLNARAFLPWQCAYSVGRSGDRTAPAQRQYTLDVRALAAPRVIWAQSPENLLNVTERGRQIYPCYGIVVRPYARSLIGLVKGIAQDSWTGGVLEPARLAGSCCEARALIVKAAFLSAIECQVPSD